MPTPYFYIGGIKMADNDFDALVEENGKEVSQDVKPVKLGRGAVAGILIGLLVVAFILTITIVSCQVEKKENVSPNEGSQISSSAVATESTLNAVENPAKNSEQSTVFAEVATTSAEISKPTNSQNSIENTTSGLNEVALPALGSEVSSKGIVLSKHVYSYEGSYVYGINISVLIGDNTKTVQYFCPKGTYDALSTTDTLNVVYQQDSSGNVSIASISK